MIKKITIGHCIFITLVIFSFQLSAQEIKIKGTVLDAKKNQPLGYCSVMIPDTYFGAHTNEDGIFEIDLPEALLNSKLVFSYIGYLSDTILLEPGKTDYVIYLDALQNPLNEVVVTGISPTTEMLEQPAVVKIVSKKVMEQTTESNIIDVLSKNVPGLSSVKTGPNVSKPFIRGLGYNRIVTLLDGIPQEGQQFEDEEVLAIDMYSIEKAEVVLGPISLEYGAEAMGGAINLIPSEPQDSDKLIHGRYFSEFQHNNGMIGNGLQLSYGNKHWSFVARGGYRIGKNYSNSIDGKVYNTGFREINASGTIVYKTSKGFSDINFSIYDNSQGIPDGSRDSLTRKFTKAIFDDPDDELSTRPIVSDEELNSYALSPIYQHIRHFRVYSKNHYNLKNTDHIYAMLSFQQNQRKEHDFPEQKDLLGVSMYLNSYNYDFRYDIDRFSNLNLSVGMNGAYQANKNVEAHDIPIPDYHLLDAGIFSMIKWKHNKWILNAGVRADTRYISGHDFYTREDPTTELLSQVFVPDTAEAELLFPAFKKSYWGASFNFGATCQVSDKVVLKAGLSQGFRPPHVSEFASNGLDGSAHSYFIGKDDLRSEYNWQFDLAANFTFSDISFGVNFFNNYIKNYIYLVQLVDDNGVPIELIPDNKTFQFQQNNADLAGIETTIDVHPRVMKGFNWISNFSFIYGFNLENKYKGKGVDGRYLPLIPPLRLFNIISQNISIKSKVLPMITLRGELDFNGAQNRFLALNSTETRTPAYVLLNAYVNFTFHYSKRSSLQLQFQVNNILDKAYQSNLNRLKYFEYYSESTNGYYGIYAMGRNIAVKLILPF